MKTLIEGRLIVLILFLGVLSIWVANRFYQANPPPGSDVPAKSRSYPLPDVLQTLLGRGGTAPANPGDKRAAFLPPRSLWVESERKLYSDLLAKGTYDLMVIPFQVQQNGIDRIGRSLMTAELAHALSGTGDTKIPDSYLVSRALGEGVRTHDKAAVYDFADRLEVKTLVWGYVGHDQENHMILTVQVEHRDQKAGVFKTENRLQRDWEAVDFSDAAPPAEAFRRMLPEVLRAIGFEAKQRTESQARAMSAALMELPESPDKMLAEQTHNSLHQAAHLTFLGLLAPSDSERAGERLFERALLRLNEEPINTPEYRLLKAYALYRLHQRPAALAALGKDNTAEVLALQALLNGNLTDLETRTAKIEPPLPRIIFEIELNELRQQYSLPGRKALPPGITRLIKKGGAWDTLLGRRLNDLNVWNVQNNAVLKNLLDQAYPVAGLSLEGIIRGQQALGLALLDSVEIDLSVVRHARKLISEQGIKWCCKPSSNNSSQLDYFDLLAALGDANLIKNVYRESEVRGIPERAIELLDHYDEVYAGKPEFANYRARTNALLAEKERPEARAHYWKLTHDNAIAAAYWEQGQTLTSISAIRALGIPPGNSLLPYAEAYIKDLPIRTYLWPELAEVLMPNRREVNLGRALAFTHADFGPAAMLLGSSDTALQIRTENLLETRFRGHPEATAALANLKLNRGDYGEAKRLYREGTVGQPELWSNYEKLGKLLIEHDGDLTAAQRVYDSYPGFKHPSHMDSVALSNYAYEAGSNLYWRGGIEGAGRLYKIAADLGTGSEGSLTSDIRLRLISGDFLGAAEGSLARAQRYNSYYAFRDYLALLHTLGYSDQAWAGFEQLADKFDNPQVWAAALVGHRINGTSATDFKQWIFRDNIRLAAHQRTGYPRRRFAPAYGLLWNMVDRKPVADLPKLLEEVQGDSQTTVTEDGLYLRQPHPLASGRTMEVHPSGFRYSLRERKTPNAKVASPFVFFADAYVALRNKDYPMAVEKFDRLAAHYGIEGGQGHYGQEPMTFAIPYFAFASAKVGDTLGFEAFIDTLSISPKHPIYFDYQLAKAFFSGLRGDTPAAIEHLKNAFNIRPHTDYRPIFSEYQYAEVCEWLYLETKKEVFRNLALNWAKKHQKIQPMYAWAYAMEAALTDSTEDRVRALAMTLYLDRNSERIQLLPRGEFVKAEKWLKANNPFTKKRAEAAPQEGI